MGNWKWHAEKQPSFTCNQRQSHRKIDPTQYTDNTVSLFWCHHAFGRQEVNTSRHMTEKKKWLNLLSERMDLSLPIQAWSSVAAGCTGIWIECPSTLDCKVARRYFPRSRPEERARSVTSQGASSTCSTPVTAWSELLMKTLTTAGAQVYEITECVLWCGSDTAWSTLDTLLFYLCHSTGIVNISDWTVTTLCLCVFTLICCRLWGFLLLSDLCQSPYKVTTQCSPQQLLCLDSTGWN